MPLLGVDGKRCAWAALLGSLCSVACSSEGGDADSDRDRSSTSDSGAGAMTFPAATGSGSSSSSGGGTDAASSGSASSGSGASEATTGGRWSDPSGQGSDATGGMPPTNGLTEEAGGGPSRGGGAPTADAGATAQGGAPGAATTSGGGAGRSPNAGGEAGRLPIAQAGAPDGTGGPQGGGGLGGTYYMPEVRWVRLAIPGSGRCVVSLSGTHLQASIYAPDGETLLLTAEALDGDGVVTELEYDYPDAAEYLLLLEPLATESDRFHYELRCDD